MSHIAEQSIKCDAGRGQESLSGAGTKVQEQVANCLFCSEIGGIELCSSVAPNGFGWTESDKPVGPSSTQKKSNSHLSSLGK